MKVIEILNKAEKPFASFELVPPLKGSDVEKLYGAIEPLLEFKPPFINITTHRDEIEFRPTTNGRQDGCFEKVTVTKRPSTVAIAAAIMKRFDLEIVPHLICGGVGRSKLENDLLDFHFMGIHNVVALRGDAVSGQKLFTPEPDGHSHCYELVQQIHSMNEGKYLDYNLSDAVATDFCVGVGGYPEKHVESPNQETDIQFLKQKVDAGADYIITQLFFDNDRFYDFVKRCRAVGITVPIVPGLKPISTQKHIDMLPRTFSIDLPEALMKEIRKCKNKEDFYHTGIEWCTMQSKDLLKHGVPAIHYYTMGKADNIREILTKTF
ncbi:methylenetetrahydrofolate reductase [Bacteroidia bacterium]|nr:methylenetetrahydrofolate reductase [Bacteroidia bacterium]